MKVQVLILDFGSQYTQLICRAVRSLGVYCEVEPYSISLKKIKEKNPEALILSGSPASVSQKKSPRVAKEILELQIPVLGICYGMQLLSHLYQSKTHRLSREYGQAELEILENEGLFKDFKKGEMLNVWMSHGDSMDRLPEGARLLARSGQCQVAAIQRDHLYGIQFHPEVSHTEKGIQILKNFLFEIAKLEPVWEMSNFLEKKSEEIKELVGEDHVLGAVSGGVDSTLLAIFLGKLLGNQFHPVMVDNGLLRLHEAEEVKKNLKAAGVDLKVIQARNLFLKRLHKITDPEKKRKIIGKTFIEVFEKELSKAKKIKYLAQGTLYPDVIESVSVKGPSHTIKTHHNVGGLPKKMKLKLLEPFRELFKDEVRALGKTMGVSSRIIGRHPFPGPGLAVRILGEVTPKRLELLRKVDAIYVEELEKQKVYDEIWQAFAVLLPVQAVGVMGDARTYESVVALRAVTSRDGMTADWYPFEKKTLGQISSRIINEVPGVNRVAYDVSSKPPATIEWE